MPTGRAALPWFFLFALLTLTLSSPAAPQTPLLVKDINSVPDNGPFSFFDGDGIITSQFVASNGNLFFLADNGETGLELWKSDGTTPGTVLLKDINFGPLSSSIGSMVDINGTLFFAADDGSTGLELWKTDATVLGTVLVKDISPGISGSSPTSLTNLNGTVYFAANDGVNGVELWKSDGTGAGTVLVKDIWSGPSSATPSSITNVNGTLYFAAAGDAGTGSELWKSDGTALGTVLVKDIAVGSGSSNPSSLVNVNGTACFAANDGATGQELWKSDGTALGTVLVKDINGAGSSTPGLLTNVNGTLFFSADDGTAGRELWKSDGTTAGTVLVSDLNSIGSSTPSFLTPMNGVLYFAATSSDFGINLFKSDGTSIGTVPVKPTGFYGSNPTGLTNVNGTLYFAASTAAGTELWKSNGTDAGTVLVKDIVAGGSSFPGYLTSVNGKVFFEATHNPSFPNQWSLWTSDGTDPGTVRVVPAHTVSSSVQFILTMNGSIYFAANDGTAGNELWNSDPSTQGTALVKDIWPGGSSSDPGQPIVIGGTFYFNANDGATGQELWKSDGTAGGTARVKDINPGTGNGMNTINPRVEFNGLLFFTADDGVNGQELWKSDGTAAGTALVKDIWPGVGGSDLIELTVMNGSLYFSADDGTHGQELWKCDGTTAGTIMVKDINTAFVGANGNPSFLTPVNGTLFFSADDGTHGQELWKSDGTTAGTVLVKDVYLGANAGAVALISFNGQVYFSGNDGSGSNQKLWKSDGTSAGTVLVKDINLGPNGFIPTTLQNLNGAIYLVADDGTHGQELWKSDGTTAGTVLVKDIWPGTSGSLTTNHYQKLVDAGGGIVLFLASDGTTQNSEIWRTDGTAAGTRPIGAISSPDHVAQYYPFAFGPNSSATLVCPYIYFAGSTVATGTELFGMLGTGGGPGYADLDGDGYGSGPVTGFCAGTPGYGPPGDCNDNDPSIHPGQPETVCDGIDTDCDGVIDDGIVCHCVANSPGLAGWWQGNGTPNDAVGGNHGILFGGATYAPGRVGQAFSLNGTTAYVGTLGDASSYSFIEDTGLFTIDAWINLTDVNALSDEAITGNISGGDKGSFFLWRNLPGQKQLRLSLQGTGGTPILDSLTPNNVITTNGWHHVAAVGNGSTVVFYVDGISYPGTGTIVTLKPTGPSTSALDIGRSGSGNYFAGLLDEVQIFDRALTAAQIQAIYNSGANGMCGAGCVQSPPGLAGWWPGSGDAGDRAPFNNNGTAFNVTYAFGGKVGNAFAFDGTGYVDIPDSPSLEATTQLTLAAWIRTGLPTNNSARILSKWTLGSSAYELLFSSDDNRLPRADISNDGTNYDALISPIPVQPNQWVHVATTFNLGVWKLFINGVVIASKTSAMTNIYSFGTSPLNIGRYSGGGFNFTGLVDEPMVFRRALSDAEIASIYNAGSQGLCALGQVAVPDPDRPLPSRLLLANPWPNPASGSVTISFELPTELKVEADIYDVAGRHVATLLHDQPEGPGEHRLTWNGIDLSGKLVAPGIYFARVSDGPDTAVRKLIMMR